MQLHNLIPLLPQHVIQHPYLVSVLAPDDALGIFWEVTDSLEQELNPRVLPRFGKQVHPSPSFSAYDTLQDGKQPEHYGGYVGVPIVDAIHNFEEVISAILIFPVLVTT